MTLLGPGDQFPDITVTAPDSAPVQLPQTLSGNFGVVLFFRGAWCPYCNAQLRAFERAHETFSALGVSVVALSVDDEATTRDLIEKGGLTFPVGHSADARAVAAATGAFVNDAPTYLCTRSRWTSRGQRLLERRHWSARPR
jgi:peroxiredoxin